MSWNFPWSEFVKKRACRYLLQHYLGHFFKEKLTLDQLSVDLYNGRGNIRQMELDVEALNEALDQSSVPLEIVDGFIDEVSVAIPWTALIQNSTEMEIHGLELTLQPKQINNPNNQAQSLESMFNSMSSMNTSLQIAEDCLKSDKDAGRGNGAGPQFEGVQKFAQTIDSVLCRIKVTLVDTVIRLEHLPHIADTGVALEIRIKRIEYFDDMALSDGSSVDDINLAKKWEPAAISQKNINLEGVQILLDEFPRNSRQQDADSNCSSPQEFGSAKSSPLGMKSNSDTSESNPGSPRIVSDPIQVAVLTGRTGVKFKIKQGESIPGPKLESEVELGALHILISPKQFHSLLELAEGLSSPATSDRQSKGQRNKNKPMSQDDFQKIERELQRQLQFGRVQQQIKRTYHKDAEGLHDIMTSSIGDGDEDQYFSLASGGKSVDLESSISSNYSLNSNRSSITTTSSKQNAPRSKKESSRSRDLQRVAEDPTTELCRYHLRLAFFTLALLHDNPRPELSKSNKMKDVSKSYFSQVFSFTAAGKTDLREMRTLFAESLHFDHIRFVGKPLNIECTEKKNRTHSSMNLDLTVGLFEAVEFLFDRRNENEKPEYTELLVFQRDAAESPNMYSSMQGSGPCIKASVKSIEQIRRTQKSIPKTDVSIRLGSCESEIDVTIVDRINSLITPEPTKRQYNMASTFTQGSPCSFSQALEEGSVSKDWKVDLQISCPCSKLSLRFPIPDLRPSSQVDKLPWWQKNLRDEILILVVDEPVLQLGLVSSQPLQQVEVTCKDVNASFRIDPNQEPVPFAFVCGEESDSDGFNTSPRMCVKFSNKTMSLLEEDPMDTENSMHLDSLNGACQFTKKDPSPFSSKKFMYGKEEEGDQSRHISEEMIMPGDRREVLEFQEKALSNTHMTLEFSLPYVNLFVPNQHFYEVLYNRVNSDLLLWEPMAPSPVPTQDSVRMSMQPFDLSCYPQALQESFSMAKSGLKYESSDDEDDQSFGYYSIHDSKYPRRQQSNKEQPSKMCLSLKIDKGKLTAITKSKMESTHGEAVVILDDANLFTVVNHNGDPSVQYICFFSNKAELYHGGEILDTRDIPVSMTMQDVYNVPDYLKPLKTIYKSDPGVCTRPMCDDPELHDMLSVAVKIKLDSTPINDLTRDEPIKEILVSVGVRGGTLRHTMAETGQSWISQILNFIDVKDYDILGYIPAKILTELHIHLWSCAVDYRPLNIPTKALLTAESFSISSNIVAESLTSLLRFVLDDAALYLTQKNIQSKPNLRKDYVCVADLERFELALRFCEGKDMKFPKTDLKVSTNRLNLRTCSDSCKALMELIQYFAQDGDLAKVSKSESQDSTDLEDIVTANDESVDSDDERSGLSESRLEHVHSLVADAMQESSVSDGNDKKKTDTTTQVFFVPNDREGNNVVPPAGALRPIIISDSADSIASCAMSEKTETFSDDEDFCIIDSPGLGITPRDGEPVVRVYAKDAVEVKENYFSLPLGRTDQLKAPDHYPPAEYRYTLKELTAVWYMYGGSDFKAVSGKEPPVTYSKKQDTKSGSSVLTMRYTAKERTKEKTTGQHRGGPGRDSDTLMELCLNKVRMQHEIYPSNTSQASRQILLINDLEIRDRVHSSSLNKFLYQYSSDSMPKQTYANMVLVKAVHTRPDPSLKAEECALRVSVQPLKLNIDQDSLMFLKTFFMDLTGASQTENQPVAVETPKDQTTKTRTASGPTPPSPPPPVMTVVHSEVSDEEKSPQESLMTFGDVQQDLLGETTVKAVCDQNSIQQPSTEAENQPVFFKSFIFSPDVPIRLVYYGKRMDREHHVDKSKIQRDHYRLQCEESKLNFSALSDQQQTRGQPPCSLKGTQHYSFDYAQQVHYPHYAQQVGPLFFKTPRKCQCFGICSEGSGSQVFYLVDEAQHSGKGANSVASMLHHHFQYKGYGETDLQLHMDNCTGQNKNNTVLGYGMWRVMTGGHQTILFSLMEAGHTKFHPDWHFGLWKMKWRSTTVETMEELANSVSASSRNKHNIPQIVDDPQYPVVFYDWSSFLKQYFKPIHHLKQYHHFRMSHENPGIVFCRQYASDDEENIDIRKNKEISFRNLPEVIEPSGLDAQRQWYLYEEVAPYCNNTQACPRPEITKPSNTSDNLVSKRKCGHCKETGHSKSCMGKITCPKLLK